MSNQSNQSNQMFVLSETDYKNSPFAKIPEHSKRSSWFLLTGGTTDDIIVDDRTTVKQIWQGRYNKLVEISKNPLSYEHEFTSSCKETTYTFNVRVKAKVLVDSPIDFYSNVRNIDIRAFFNNQFSLDVAKITRKYSIMDYSKLDEELTQMLTSTHVADATTGLSYSISSVITEPNAEARKFLKEIDDMELRNKKKQMAGAIAGGNRGKTFEEAVWEENAQGLISDTEAIEKINDYGKKGYQDKIAMLLQLRNEGFITDADIAAQAQTLLPSSAPGGVKSLPKKETKALTAADEFYDE